METPTLADYRLISALMQALPKDGKWRRAERDAWLAAVAATIDLIIETEG